MDIVNSKCKPRFYHEYALSKLKNDGYRMAVASNAIAHKRVHIPVIDKDNKPLGVISRRGLKHIIGDALNIPDTE